MRPCEVYLLTYLFVGKKRILTFGSQILLESSLLSLSTVLWSLLRQTVNLEHKSGWYWLPQSPQSQGFSLAASGQQSFQSLQSQKGHCFGVYFRHLLFMWKRERDGHLFLHYGVSSNPWGWLLRRFGLFWCMPFLLCMAIKAWSVSPFKRCKLLLQKSAPLVVQWSIRRGR